MEERVTKEMSLALTFPLCLSRSILVSQTARIELDYFLTAQINSLSHDLCWFSSGDGVASAGNLNHIFTGKTGQNGKNNLGELSIRQKLFKTTKTIQAI